MIRLQANSMRSYYRMKHCIEMFTNLMEVRGSIEIAVSSKFDPKTVEEDLSVEIMDWRLPKSEYEFPMPECKPPMQRAWWDKVEDTAWWEDADYARREAEKKAARERLEEELHDAPLSDRASWAAFDEDSAQGIGLRLVESREEIDSLRAELNELKSEKTKGGGGFDSIRCTVGGKEVKLNPANLTYKTGRQPTHPEGGCYFHRVDFKEMAAGLGVDHSLTIRLMNGAKISRDFNSHEDMMLVIDVLEDLKCAGQRLNAANKYYNFKEVELRSGYQPTQPQGEAKPPDDE